MVWPSVLGDYVTTGHPQWRRIDRWIREDKVGGFTMSLGSPLEIALKLNAMQQLAQVPLLIGADLEFGAGSRARGGLVGGIDLGGATLFPPEMAVGAAGDTMLAYEQGRVTALEGRAIGIHIAYAPILDVNNNPANPVINTRAYGGDPQLAARMGTAFIRGVQEHGMIAAGKHFPGHGDTGINSHLALPVINASRERLDTVELVPFRAAVRADVGAIMTFHGAMPALDSSGVPGTLSSRVLGDLLRVEMGFKGIIISDAMDMRGVLDQFGAVEAAKRAVAAGADVLIQPLDVTQTIDAVAAGVAEGRYPETRLDSSVRLILTAKRRMGLDRRKLVSPDSARAIVGDSSHVAAVRTVAERSITLVKDSAGLVPIGAKVRRVLSISVARRTDVQAGQTFVSELRRFVPTVRHEFVDADDPEGKLKQLVAVADSVDLVVIGSYVAHRWDIASVSAPTAFVDFVNALMAKRKGRRPRPRTPVAVVAFGNPYLLQQIPRVPTYLVAWSGIPSSQAAAARALGGSAAITGQLPISIPPLIPLGAGIQRPAATARD